MLNPSAVDANDGQANVVIRIDGKTAPAGNAIDTVTAAVDFKNLYVSTTFFPILSVPQREVLRAFTRIRFRLM